MINLELFVKVFIGDREDRFHPESITRPVVRFPILAEL